MRIITVLLTFLIMTVPAFAGQTDTHEDALRVSGKAVVFFGPSQAEYLSMSDKEKHKVDQLLYDFYHHRGRVLPFLELYAIEGPSSAHSQIRIELDDNKTITYHRKDLGQVVGLIMTDGHQEPKLFLGAPTDSQIIDMCYEYFGLGQTAN
jgi:hypothetical protein